MSDDAFRKRVIEDLRRNRVIVPQVPCPVCRGIGTLPQGVDVPVNCAGCGGKGKLDKESEDQQQ